MNRSKNYIDHICEAPDALEHLNALRKAFASCGRSIKWYKTSTGYSIYFRGKYTRKVKNATLLVEEVTSPVLSMPAFDYVESTFTPEQVAA
jgi:hypothetical protein